MTRRNSKGQFTGPSEDAIQRAFVQIFKMHCGDCEGMSIPNDGTASKKHTAALVARGLRAGAADYLVWWRDGTGCAMCFLEFKSFKGRQSEKQKDFETAALATGASYVVVRSWEEAWRALQARGAPLAKRLEETGVARLVTNHSRYARNHPTTVEVPLAGVIS